jgi:hypothetical protein
MQQMLGILSPVRPQQVRMASGLGDIAASLRGGVQPGGQLLNQLRSKPGVKASALAQHLGHLDPDAKLSPLQLAGQVRSPKLFAQRGMTDRLDDEGIHELATDLIYGPHFEERRTELLRSMLRDAGHYGVDDSTVQLANHLLQAMGTDRPSAQALGAAQDFAWRFLGQDTNDIYMNELAGDAFEMARQQAGGKSMKPGYEGYQRQRGLTRETNSTIPYNAEPSYFETVLRGTPSRARGDLNIAGQTDHFMNPSQLGHARGSMTPSGNVYVEELQSDALEGMPNHPALEGIYGKLGRMLVDRSAEAGAPSISFPDANRIASVRDFRQLPFFQDVYDKQLSKQFYDPLSKRGVPLRQENGWTTMDLPEGVLNAIKNEGLLNYKRGGSVP